MIVYLVDVKNFLWGGLKMGFDFGSLFANFSVGILVVLALLHILGYGLKVKMLDKFNLLGKLAGKYKGFGLGASIVFIAAVSFGFLAIPNFLGGILGGTSAAAAATTTDTSTTSVSSQFCPDTGFITFDSRAINVRNTSTDYIESSDFYVKSADGTFEHGVTDTSGYDGNVSVPCGGPYTVSLVTERDSASSADAVTKDPSNANPQVSFNVNRLSTLQFRVLDNTEGASGYQYIFNNNAAAGTNVTSTYQTNMNVSNVYDTDTTAPAGETLGVGGYLDLQLDVKTTVSQMVFGEPGLRNWLCVDIGTNSQYEQPVVGVNGQRLVDAKSSMMPDDLVVSQIAGSEYCYILPGQIVDTPTKIDFYVAGRGGVNPSDDIVVYFLPEGRYLSSKGDGNTVKTGVYTDAATPALVDYTSGTYYPYFNIIVV